MEEKLMNEPQMTPEVIRKVSGLKETIDMHDRGKTIAYGREEQASIGKFTDFILQGAGTTEVGEAGELLTKVIAEIESFKSVCDKESTGFWAFFRKQKLKLKTLQTKYKSLADSMDTLVRKLQKKDMALSQISHSFDVMYDENISMCNFLTIVICAGEQKLEEEKQKLDVMQKEAQLSGDLMEIQKVSDFNDDIIRFERRIHDLKLTRTIAIQQAPQIRNIQKSADEVSESIKTTIINAIPLWKSQMAIALGMQAVREGMNSVKAVKDATNAMIIANSQMNKQLTLDVAQSLERGIVDIETINKVNQNLIDSLSGSYDIVQKAIEKSNG